MEIWYESPVFDSQVRPILRVKYDLEEATVFKADTLEELAVKMGIEKDPFLKTIEDYNGAVQEGDYNPSIKDGKSAKTSHLKNELGVKI